MGRSFYGELAGTALPIVYMCLLPWLSAWRCTPIKDPLPHEPTQACWAGQTDNTGAPTLSDYINTPQATGAMAATFLFPMMYIRLDEEYAESHMAVSQPCWTRLSYSSMVIFFLSFGGLLTFPCASESESQYLISNDTKITQLDIHLAFVAVLGVSAIAHFATMLRLNVRREKQCGRLVCSCILIWGIISMVGVVVFAGFIFLSPCCPVELPWPLNQWPKCMFHAEVSGLSMMALYPTCWRWLLIGDAPSRSSSAAAPDVITSAASRSSECQLIHGVDEGA